MSSKKYIFSFLPFKRPSPYFVFFGLTFGVAFFVSFFALGCFIPHAIFCHLPHLIYSIDLFIPFKLIFVKKFFIDVFYRFFIDIPSRNGFRTLDTHWIFNLKTQGIKNGLKTDQNSLSKGNLLPLGK